MIEVRLAKLSDVPRLIPMAKEFFEESKFGETFGFTEKEDDTMKYLAGVVRAPDHGFFVAANETALAGFLIVGVRPWAMNFDQKITYELFFYVAPKYRRGKISRELVSTYEAWAKDQGAVAIEFGLTDKMKGVKMEKFLTRLGYSAQLKSFIKKVGV